MSVASPDKKYRIYVRKQTQTSISALVTPVKVLMLDKHSGGFLFLATLRYKLMMLLARRSNGAHQPDAPPAHAYPT